MSQDIHFDRRDLEMPVSTRTPDDEASEIIRSLLENTEYAMVRMEAPVIVEHNNKDG